MSKIVESIKNRVISCEDLPKMYKRAKAANRVDVIEAIEARWEDDRKSMESFRNMVLPLLINA